MKFNIAKKEGEETSATVFFDADSFVATPEHPRFQDILAGLRSSSLSDDEIRALFDITVPLTKHFKHLSERVTINAGNIFFDGVAVDDALSKTIVAFYSDGHGDFMPLVNFMEKITLNPNPASVKQLFRWLAKHKFGIAPDGDFIAYKGIGADGLSSSSGTAMVNGDVIKGRIPNKEDTIIEMPRDKVAFDPSRGCSTGLHVGNWSYASSFAAVTLRVKVNPRDVVSVPTDCSDQKMRVCRYRVLGQVTAEDKSMLFVDARERLAVSKAVERKIVVPTPDPIAEDTATRPAKKGSKKAAKPVTEFPEWYELFTKKHFEACDRTELHLVAKEFELVGYSKLPKPALIAELLKAGRRRKRTWPKEG